MIHIATIGKAVGLKGELKLHLFTDFPNQFQANRTFQSDNNLFLEIEYFYQNKSIIKFKNFSSREETMKLINKKLYSTEEKTRKDCKLLKDEYKSPDWDFSLNIKQAIKDNHEHIDELKEYAHKISGLNYSE